MPNFSAPAPTNVQESVKAAVDMFSEGAATSNNSDDFSEAFLENLLSSIEGLDMNDDEALDSMLESMMSEMMCKETLCPPIQNLVDQFPAWLDDNRASLSREELTNYEQQYEGYRDVLGMLGAESDNGKLSDEVMAKLGEVQELGNPPEALLNGLLPDFGSDDGCQIM